MALTDDLVSVLIDVAEEAGVQPVDLARLIAEGEDPTAIGAAIAENINPSDEIVGVLVDFTEEFILSELTLERQITPGNVERIQDDIEGGAVSVIGAVILVTIAIETASAGQIDEVPAEIIEAVALLGVDDVTGREIEVSMQEGIDPALKQLVHTRTRSKQADFQDFAEANSRTKSFGGEVPTRSGDIPQDFQDLFHPDDFGYFGDPDTYGTLPAQTRLFETVAMQSSEPEELIEEPVQYGIPVPRRAIEQVAHIANLPEDAKSVYKAVIDALPRTENLIQDYARLTEFNFRLREKVLRGALSPVQARKLIEPELRDVIQNAVPESRLRDVDRTADEVVDILAGELERNFALLDSLPADPPSQADFERWFRLGVITSQEYQQLYNDFGSQPGAFGKYLESQAIRQGWESVQKQHALGRIETSEARLRLRLIGFSTTEAADILAGADGDAIVTDKLAGTTGETQLPVDLATEIGPSRGAALRASGVETLATLAELTVDELVSITGMSDTEAEQALSSAQVIIESGEEAG
jgi:hypothetical protein